MTLASPVKIQQIIASDIGELSLVEESPNDGEYRIKENLWVTPDGNYLSSEGGDIFRTSDLTYVSSLKRTGPELFLAVVINESQDKFLALSSDSEIHEYKLSTWELIDTNENFAAAKHLVSYNGKFYVIYQRYGCNYLEKIN